MIRLLNLRNAILLFVLCYPCLTTAQTKSDDKKFLDDTRNSYSILRRQGLSEINASVVPNWDLVFVNLPAAQKPEAYRLAGKLRFDLYASADGTVRVKHRIIGPKLAKAREQAAQTIASPVELSVTGFLMSWAPIMLTQLIPEKLDQFVLQDLNSEYLLTYTEKDVEVSVRIQKDSTIKELRTPRGSIKPSLKRTENGFVLTGYEGDNEDSVIGRVVMKAEIESSMIGDKLLPRTVSLNGTAADTNFNLKFNFINYRLKTKPGI